MNLQRVNFEVIFSEDTPKQVISGARDFLLGFADVHYRMNDKRIYGSGPSVWVKRRLSNLKSSSRGRFINSIKIFETGYPQKAADQM